MADTGEVLYSSILKRHEWMKQGMIQAKSLSFTAPYTGSTMDSVVWQQNKSAENGGDGGHETRFQFDGNLVSTGVMDDETAYGTGETKPLFSDFIRFRRMRTTVSNGDKFKAVEINSLPLTEFQDSRDKLSDKWVRMKDQVIFDVAQQSATHRIVANDFSFNSFLTMENALKTGIGLVEMLDATKATAQRTPLRPYRLENGDSVWLFLIDSYAKTKFLTDPNAQAIIQSADVRGSDNMLIKGVIGRLGNLLVVEAPVFFGETLGTKLSGDFVDPLGYGTWNRTKVQISGLRTFHVGNNDTKIVPKKWSGENITTAANDKIFSRGLLLGAGAIQFSLGKPPEFHVQHSPDYGITSESCLEAWVGCKATKLYKESGEQYPVPIEGDSFGIIAVDIDVTSLVKP